MQRLHALQQFEKRTGSLYVDIHPPQAAGPCRNWRGFGGIVRMLDDAQRAGGL